MSNDENYRQASHLKAVPSKQRSFISENMSAWAPLAAALILVVFFALGLVLAYRISDLSSQIVSLVKKESEKISADELAKTRYDAEIRTLDFIRESQERSFHEIKVKLDYQNALYQDDVRRGLLGKKGN